jgi:hypothetical protein
MSSASSSSTTKSNTKEVSIQDVAVDGKYNPALFLPATPLGKDALCQEAVQHGLETIEVRKFIQRVLLEAKSDQCSDLFKTRNRLASEFKLATVNKCSYCNKECSSEKLLIYSTLAHAEDQLIQELGKLVEKKDGVFKAALAFPLETRVRDVRFREPLVINAGCYLVLLTRCPTCINEPKVEIIE